VHILKFFRLSILCIPFFLNALETHSMLSKKEKLTSYLADLVAINTVTSNQKGSLEALKWVEKQLNGLKLYFNYHEFNGYHSLVITTQNTKKPVVWLVSHIDVVPGHEFLFKPRIEKHKMYGRGSYDMKMAIACYILLMHELKDQLSAYNIGIMLTSDEEIGGMNGVRCLLKEGYSSEVAFLPDGGFDWNFEEAAKGVLQIKVVSQGKAAHSSRPWNGENAITNLLCSLEEIKNYFDQEKLMYGSYYPTANIGLIEGGKGINQVPDHAEAKIDIRFPPSMAADQIYVSLQNGMKKYPKITLENMIQASPNKADVNQSYFQNFRKIAKELYDIKIGTVLSHGSSDARFFGERDIPVLVITSKGGEIHSDDEWVDLEDLNRLYEVLKKWVISVGKTK
jgi:succinyl-diaminopimelate desuccinylase